VSNQKEGNAGCIDEGASKGWQGIESGGRRTAGASNAGSGGYLEKHDGSQREGTAPGNRERSIDATVTNVLEE
jgi:hypothetical protein